MNKRLKPTIWALLVLFSASIWSSCDKEASDMPLSLVDIENNVTKLHYGSRGGITIIGGDGNYSFSTESPLLTAEMTHSNYILFEPLGVGDATVIIKDSSGESYILKVTIAYKAEKIVVSKLDATVVGNAMTMGDQKELKEKALATIPVIAGGGYKFIYTEGEDLILTNGTAFIYADNYGESGIEGTFTREIVKGDDESNSYMTYTLYYRDVSRTYILMKYSEPVLKSSPPGDMQFQFTEDLKDQYKTDYPDVEQVYTSQVVGSMVVE